MTKEEILKEINSIYATKRTESRLDYLERFNYVLKTDDEFKNLYLEFNSISTLISQNKINNINSNDLIQKKSKVGIKLFELITKNEYDLNHHYSCKFCKDTGVYKNHSCKCKTKLIIQLLKENSNLPKQAIFNINDNKISDFNVPQSKILSSLYKKGVEWIDNFENTEKLIFFIPGSVGIGKTSFAFAMANYALSNQYSVFYATAFEANNIFVDKQFNKGNYKYNDLLKSDLLIIDDLGTEVINTIGLEYLFNVIDTRINNKQKTIILTNLTTENFCKRYGERSTSRLTNKNYSIAVDYILGKDLRKL